MNRTIKFRGLNKPTKLWIYGYLIVDEKYCQVWQEGDVPVPVDIETVGQFTGLLDKNKKEIYEGDVVKFDGHTYEEKFTGAIEFRDGKFCDNYYGWEIGKYREVIGNIYENPELLTPGREV